MHALRPFVLAIGLLGGGSTVAADDRPDDGLRGLPASDEAYRAERARIREDDAATRFDANVQLNAAERRVDARLVEMRRELTRQYRAAGHFPPAEPFHTVREEIRSTPLYKMLRAMPKGGALHLHTSSTAPGEWIVTHGIHEPGCHVCWPADHGNALRGQLGFYAPQKAPPGYQAVGEVISREPDFPRQLLTLITINATDASRPNAAMWTKFDHIFQRVGGLLSYQPVFLKYYAAAFQTLLDDNVFYVELRAGLGDLYDLGGKTWSDREVVGLLWDLRKRARTTHPRFDLKLIDSGQRRATLGNVWTRLERAVELRRLWAARNFVLGFDLVGEEDAGHTTAHFLPDWVRLKAYLAERSGTLPFYFHDGESDWPGDQNLYDAFLLGSRRIGHGFNLFRVPSLQERFKREGIAVEVCPISNQQLRYVHDLRTHPAAGYLNQGIPCVLSNDDPGIFGNDGLSYDFWEAVMAWRLDLRAIKQLALNSLVYSGMTASEKAGAIEFWRASWDRWIDRCDTGVP